MGMHGVHFTNPLACAVERCNYPVVVALLDAGASPDFMGKYEHLTTGYSLALLNALDGLDDRSSCHGPTCAQFYAEADSLVKIIHVLLKQPTLDLDAFGRPSNGELLFYGASCMYRHAGHGADCVYKAVVRDICAVRDGQSRRWSPLRAAFIGSVAGGRSSVKCF